MGKVMEIIESLKQESNVSGKKEYPDLHDNSVSAKKDISANKILELGYLYKGSNDYLRNYFDIACNYVLHAVELFPEDKGFTLMCVIRGYKGFAITPKGGDHNEPLVIEAIHELEEEFPEKGIFDCYQKTMEKLCTGMMKKISFDFVFRDFEIERDYDVCAQKAKHKLDFFPCLSVLDNNVQLYKEQLESEFPGFSNWYIEKKRSLTDEKEFPIPRKNSMKQ